ncbi:MAG: ribosome biogenesis GTPase Der [Ectothiorhodospiraceae bacterium]|nr:ribosome biogenesis GTPase Der [Ectothiorhodospiraceae bacterium]
MAKPIVAIVGRPNVGKSTLFNRLIGRRQAIVFGEPGVTRDRHYGESDWTGKEFIVIDTGGYVPDSSDVFEEAIREQVKQSIGEADVAMFVVDGRDGIMPMDEEIAGILRKHAKRVILVVNKIDSEKQDAETGQFYSLGLGDPYPISAVSGRSVGDMLDAVLAEVQEFSGEDEDAYMHLAIIGKPNVGKSSLTNAFLGFDRSIVTDIPGTTRDSVDSVLKYYGKKIILVDTAGLRKKSKVKENIEFFSTLRTLKSIQRCDVALMLMDAVEGVTHQDLDVLGEAIQYKKGVVIALNKWDLVDKEDEELHKFREKIYERLPMHTYIPVISTSAETKQRIYKALETCIEVFEERKKRIETSALNDFLFELLRQTPPPSSPTGKETKFYYATQVKGSPPVLLLFMNETKFIPDTYQRFVEKQIRGKFGFTGVPLTVNFRKRKN